MKRFIQYTSAKFQIGLKQCWLRRDVITINWICKSRITVIFIHIRGSNTNIVFISVAGPPEASTGIAIMCTNRNTNHTIKRNRPIPCSISNCERNPTNAGVCLIFTFPFKCYNFVAVKSWIHSEINSHIFWLAADSLHLHFVHFVCFTTNCYFRCFSFSFIAERDFSQRMKIVYSWFRRIGATVKISLVSLAVAKSLASNTNSERVQTACCVFVSFIFAWTMREPFPLSDFRSPDFIDAFPRISSSEMCCQNFLWISWIFSLFFLRTVRRSQRIIWRALCA